MGKLSRYVAKSKVSTAAAVAAVLEDGGDDDSDVIEAASREAFKEEALSSLLVSAFAGAGLAQHLSLQSEVCVGYRMSSLFAGAAFLPKIYQRLLPYVCVSILPNRPLV